MSTKAQDLDRTFFDLPTDENSNIETAEFLANLAISGKTTWPVLLESERVLIVSEAGMGKTYECQRQQKKLWEEGRSAFFVELAGLATDSLERQFSTEEKQRFDDWKVAQTERAFFFLDSVDELKLTQRSFDTTLKQFVAALGGNLDRACIVLTTRPTALDLNAVRSRLPIPEKTEVFVPEDYFANVAMSVNEKPSGKQSTPAWRFVALSALDENQMRALAAEQGVTDPDALLAAVNAHNAHDFAKRPLDFLELCGDWKLQGHIRSHREQVDSSIDIKLRARGDRSERTQLPPQRARDGATRLALAALLSRKLTIWHSNDNDRSRGDASLDPTKILNDWSDDEVKTLLERPLFGFATYGRVRFHNRSIIEFLAAERLRLLIERGLPIRALMRLLFATTPEGKRIAKPSLQPVAAWLAPHISPVCAELLEHEPSVLLRYGDPGSLSLTLRTQSLVRYVHVYGAGGWRGQRIPHLQVQRFARNDLGEVIGNLWAGGISNPEVRETLLELIGAGQMVGCADIAYGTAIASDHDLHDRLNGLLALAQLQDQRLAPLLDQIVLPSKDWPEELIRAAINHLFPQYMSVSQLVTSLAHLTPKAREVAGISVTLPLTIARGRFERGALTELQNGIAALVRQSCHWHDQYYRVTSGRQDLVPALLTVTRHRLEAGESDPGLFDAIALAGQLSESEHDATEGAQAMKAVLGEVSSDARARVFWANDRLIRDNYPKGDSKPHLRLYHHSRGILHVDEGLDAAWVIDALADLGRPVADREVALEMALFFTGDQLDRVAWLRKLVGLCGDNTELEKRAKEFLNAVENPGPPPAWQVEAEKRKEKSRRKHARNISSWKLFWRELNNDPEAAFSKDRIGNTSWNLWRAMERDSRDHSFSGWNRGFIEQVFSKSMANRFKDALVAAWRRDRPTLKSERPADQRNSYQMGWCMGLAGLYAESEDPSWASRLTAEEADLACRYALVDLGGLPGWLAAVANVYPAIVDHIIGRELSNELEDAEAQHSMLLQEVSRAPHAVTSLFLERIRSWLKASLTTDNASLIKSDKVERAATLLLEFGDEGDATYLGEAAISRLRKVPESSEVLFWLPILAHLDLAACVDEMERLAGAVQPSQRSQVVEWFSSLFGHRSGIALSGFQERPELLLRLARLANRHIRHEDDLFHDEVYSPGPRDNAQHARSTIANALLGMTGPGAWDIKMKFADDPEVAHYRDRIRAIALDRLAEDWDSVVFDEAGIAQLERDHDYSPSNRIEMAALLDARLADIEDLLLHDASPRELWATIKVEKLLRRAVAAELQKLARHIYLVNQEAVTGDEKETDIRLASSAAPHEAVIELKIGENGYSISDLREALHTQLVGKYMAPEHRRVGCLLISIATDKFWIEPDTGRRVESEDVIALLDAEAKALAADLGYGAFLTVRALDLRPRKPRIST